MKNFHGTKLESICANLLEELFGDHVLRNPNFSDTPKRMAKMYHELLSSPSTIRNEIDKALERTFPTKYGGIIILPNIQTISFCPHHLLPVEYDIIIGYIPREDIKTVLGASKPERVAQYLSKTAVLQEDYTQYIAEEIFHAIKPEGIGVVVKGKHSCMRLRGIKNNNAEMITSVMMGSFRKNPETRSEFLTLVKL